VNQPHEEPLAVARRELAPGERLVWADRRRRPARRRWPRLVFGLIFGGAALAWIVAALQSGGQAGGFLPLLGVPFLLLGIALAVGWLPRRGRRATVYAITDRRLLIIEDGSVRRVRSLMPDEILTLERRERPDGSGDLVFRNERVVRDDLRLRRDGPPNQTFIRRRAGFFDIPEVRRVEAAVQALRAGQLPDRPGGRGQRVS
jgi:hypothetical protein